MKAVNRTPGPFQHRLHLVQVGLLGNVSAIAEQVNGACRGVGTIRSDTPLEEFLARPNFDIPDGTPLIRLDLTSEEVFWDRVFSGPSWLAEVPPGHVELSIGQHQRYAGEPWDRLAGKWVASDVYAELATKVGVVVERLTPNPLS